MFYFKTTIKLLYHILIMIVNKNVSNLLKFCFSDKNRYLNFKKLSIEKAIELCYTISEERKVQSNENLTPGFNNEDWSIPSGQEGKRI